MKHSTKMMVVPFIESLPNPNQQNILSITKNISSLLRNTKINQNDKNLMLQNELIKLNKIYDPSKPGIEVPSIQMPQPTFGSENDNLKHEKHQLEIEKEKIAKKEEKIGMMRDALIQFNETLGHEAPSVLMRTIRQLDPNLDNNEEVENFYDLDTSDNESENSVVEAETQTIANALKTDELQNVLTELNKKVKIVKEQLTKIKTPKRIGTKKFSSLKESAMSKQPIKAKAIPTTSKANTKGNGLPWLTRNYF